jgi:hypothetical protein
MGIVDIITFLNSQQQTSLQQPEIIVGNTNINNENREQGGDDSVNNATGQARENPDTGR